MLFILAALSLTSCYDAHEPDDVLHVWVIGVDRGISDKWRLTLLFSSTEELTGSPEEARTPRSEGSESDDTISIDAPSFFTGIDLLNASIPRRLSFTHAQAIVFSQEIAQSGLVGNYIMPIIRFRQIRKSARVIVVKDTAKRFLEESIPFAGRSISEDFLLLLRESGNTALFPDVTLQNFYNSIHSPCCQPAACLGAINDSKSFIEKGEPWGTEFTTGGQYLAGSLPRSGENKIEFFGTALFREDTMVGELNGDETRFLLMARGEFKRAFFTIQDPRRPELIIPLDVRMNKKPKIKITFEEGRPFIDLKPVLELDLLAVQSRIPYELSELQPIIEEEFRKTVKQGIEDVIQICQGLNIDVFAFGKHAAKHFLTTKEMEDFNWNSRFRDAVITVNADVFIRRTGRQITL